MEWEFSDAVAIVTLFLIGLWIFGWVSETYAPKLLDWIEKRVTR